MTQILHGGLGSFCCAALILLLAARPAPAEPIARERLTVVDGDSITVDGREWRLRGYDTPETNKAFCEAERRLGLAAASRLQQLVAGGSMLDLQGGDTLDRYKRPLGDLLVDGVNVRDTMIAEGWARPYQGGRRKKSPRAASDGRSTSGSLSSGRSTRGAGKAKRSG